MSNKVEIFKNDNPNAHKCILCAVNNPRGQSIAKDMLRWLKPIYEIHVIWHDGTKYEYPGIKYLQDLCISINEPCLYLHTRGAYHFHSNTTMQTHKLWRQEFGQSRDIYFKLVDTDVPAAACPFSGKNKHTWYNGFVVNVAAMKAIPEIQPTEDRMFFERIFRDTEVNICTTKLSNIDDEAGLKLVREYLKKKFR